MVSTTFEFFEFKFLNAYVLDSGGDKFCGICTLISFLKGQFHVFVLVKVLCFEIYIISATVQFFKVFWRNLIFFLSEMIGTIGLFCFFKFFLFCEVCKHKMKFCFNIFIFFYNCTSSTMILYFDKDFLCYFYSVILISY